MPSRVILVHGFNVRDGGSSTSGKLRPYLEALGLKVIEFKYGWKGLLGVRFGSKKTARRLASIMQPGDIAIGHSNGCNLINTAMWEYGCLFSNVHYINPALDRDMPLQWFVNSASVYFSRHDMTVALSAFLWAHDWGDMGRTGYVGPPEARYRNFNTNTPGHSSIFKQADWLTVIAERINGQTT